jgi:phosphoribosyl-ATP pyrophosphohydrolase
LTAALQFADERHANLGDPVMPDDAKPPPASLEALYSQFVAQKAAKPTASRVAELLSQDVRKIAKKLGEEAVETAVAAVSGPKAEVIAESSDLLFRLLVLWAKVGVDPDKVMADLVQRHGPKARPAESPDTKTPPAPERRP